MKSEILTQTDHLIFPLVAAVLFVSIFLGAVWRVLRPGARQACAERAAIVFDDTGVQSSKAGEGV